MVEVKEIACRFPYCPVKENPHRKKDPRDPSGLPGPLGALGPSGLPRIPWDPWDSQDTPEPLRTLLILGLRESPWKHPLTNSMSRDVIREKNFSAIIIRFLYLRNYNFSKIKFSLANTSNWSTSNTYCSINCRSLFRTLSNI